jgi:hypothetical protein
MIDSVPAIQVAADTSLDLADRSVGGQVPRDTPAADPSADVADFEDLIRTWLPLSFALNAINRSMHVAGDMGRRVADGRGRSQTPVTVATFGGLWQSFLRRFDREQHRLRLQARSPF